MREGGEAAKLMKRVDPSIRLIACGSSAHAMKTCPEWDRIALSTYDLVILFSASALRAAYGTNDDLSHSILSGISTILPRPAITSALSKSRTKR
ncbi:MAG: hypothetical protein ACLRSW_13155 [Christensenellaceae bacterium]